MVTKKYTDIEIRTIDRKFAHPDEIVLCPRCKRKLEYKVSLTGTSIQVKCPTEGCLNDSIRGL